MPNFIRRILEIVKIGLLFCALTTCLYLLLEHPGKPAATPRASELLGIPQAQLLPAAEGHWTKLTPAEAQALRQVGAQFVN